MRDAFNRVRRSDFSVWSNDELVVVVDYYPESQLLLTQWRRRKIKRRVSGGLTSLETLIRDIGNDERSYSIADYLED